VFVLLLAILSPGWAPAVELSETQLKNTDTSDSMSASNRLAPSELARSRTWGLSETEWQRYKLLMQGIRGSISPSTISPIEVLGIHARNDDERRRYAEQWVRIMREDAGRILAFQRAYDAAGKRLYPNELMIDVGLLPDPNENDQILNANDRVLLFTRPDCLPCDALLNQLLKQIDRVSGIDFYIAGFEPGDDLAIRRWAVEHGIKPDWVRTRRVTLNHEAGVLERLTQGKAEIPYLMRRREGEISPLRASAL
jgi:integrating conjugative element protein (TIGR03759 family)